MGGRREDWAHGHGVAGLLIRIRPDRNNRELCLTHAQSNQLGHRCYVNVRLFCALAAAASPPRDLCQQNRAVCPGSSQSPLGHLGNRLTRSTCANRPQIHSVRQRTATSTVRPWKLSGPIASGRARLKHLHYHGSQPPLFGILGRVGVCGLEGPDGLPGINVRRPGRLQRTKKKRGTKSRYDDDRVYDTTTTRPARLPRAPGPPANTTRNSIFDHSDCGGERMTCHGLRCTVSPSSLLFTIRPNMPGSSERARARRTGKSVFDMADHKPSTRDSLRVRHRDPSRETSAKAPL
jgi:hypothetical protein